MHSNTVEAIARACISWWSPRCRQGNS